MIFISCGRDSGNRCRSQEEMQMRCQLEYVEKYNYYQIPDWIKEQCKREYFANGCY
jgi:hypothetical protein